MSCSDNDVLLLEGTAALVWELLEDDLTRNALERAVAASLAGDAEQVVDRALEALRQADLLAG